jgi:hypothetical protein
MAQTVRGSSGGSEDNEHLGRPSTSKTEENVEKISEIVDLRFKRLIKSTTWRS